MLTGKRKLKGMQDYLFKNNKEQEQYQLVIGSYVAFIDYEMNGDGDVFLTHTEVPAELEGKGVGSELVKETLQSIERHGQHVVPLCPFVASYMKRHPEWIRILAEIR